MPVASTTTSSSRLTWLIRSWACSSFAFRLSLRPSSSSPIRGDRSPPNRLLCKLIFLRQRPPRVPLLPFSSLPNPVECNDQGLRTRLDQLLCKPISVHPRPHQFRGSTPAKPTPLVQRDDVTTSRTPRPWRDSGAFPNAKLIRCSCSSSSVTCASFAAARRRSSSGVASISDWNCLPHSSHVFRVFPPVERSRAPRSGWRALH